MIDVIGGVLPRAHVIVGIEFGELDPMSAPENDRCLCHLGPPTLNSPVRPTLRLSCVARDYAAHITAGVRHVSFNQ